jgi:ABC-type amino acid transport substrate-binding protein
MRLIRSAVAVVIALTVSATAISTAQAEEEKSALGEIQKRGILKVALYKNYPPFSNDNKGADADLAAALAAKLGVKLSVLWFDAGENMEDDLRNMVWKGHYLGYGPADVLMHAPIDRAYMAKNDKVKFFAPYHRERYAVARNIEQIALLENFDAFEKLPLGIEGDTLAAKVMLTANDGRIRDMVRPFKTAYEAIAALKAGTVSGVIAQQGELEAGLAGDKRFAIDLPPDQIMKMRQWPMGLAVKAESVDLEKALQQAMKDLTDDGSVSKIMAKNGIVYRAP